MLARIVGRLLLLALPVTGCATTRTKPPPLQAYELGIWRATFRDYGGSGQSICTGEPRWLQDEISAVNGVLSRWLERTGHGPEADWVPADMKLLEDGAQTLPPVLEVHQANLTAMKACSFADQRVFPSLIDRGLDYVVQARARVEEAPKIRAALLARTALELWRKERPRRELAAKNRCPDRVRPGSAQLYYAWQTEEGQLRFLFCDGARVAGHDGALEFEAPSGLSRRDRKRVKPRRYLEAASEWDRARVDVPPNS